MKIKVNGDETTIEKEGSSVADLLELSKVENPDMVSVQVNGNFVEKSSYHTVTVSESDEIDFLYFMGGGS